MTRWIRNHDTNGFDKVKCPSIPYEDCGVQLSDAEVAEECLIMLGMHNSNHATRNKHWLGKTMYFDSWGDAEAFRFECSQLQMKYPHAYGCVVLEDTREVGDKYLIHMYTKGK